MKSKVILAVLILFGALVVFRVIQDWDGEGKGRAFNALLGGAIVIAFFGVRKAAQALWRSRVTANKDTSKSDAW
jgi:hypothetical protein